jgi:hypothetical protein
VAIDVDISGVAPPEDVIGLVAVTDVTPPLVESKAIVPLAFEVFEYL